MKDGWRGWRRPACCVASRSRRRRRASGCCTRQRGGMNRSTKRKSRMPDIPNLSELTEQVEQTFFEAMRRPLGDGDRPFYWSYCYSDAEFNALMIANLLRANIPQRLIYIYDKTGLLGTLHSRRSTVCLCIPNSPHLQNCKSDLSLTKIYDYRRSAGFS
jgi:hypothetical protein